MKKKAHELTDEQLEELRGALEAEKDAVEEELVSYGKLSDKGWEGSSESDGEEADPIDAADNIEELGVNAPLVAELETRRKDIIAALEKMDKGTYGICEVSGDPISYDRLEANPAARTLVEYA